MCDSYISSRIFLHHPPGEGHVRPQAPEALNRAEEELLEGEPEVNQYVCIAVILLSIGVMAATAEWVSRSSMFVIYVCSEPVAACREHPVRQIGGRYSGRVRYLHWQFKKKI